LALSNQLQAPGTKRLKLKYYRLLSSFALFNLRCYIKAAAAATRAVAITIAASNVGAFQSCAFSTKT
jgi:hypothetical protein